MHKQWLAMLSVLGLAGSAARVQGQVLKGAEPVKTRATKNTKQTKTSNGATKGKLDVNQQTLRNQNQGTANGNGADANARTTGAQHYTVGVQGNANNQLTKAKDDAALTKAGATDALTKAKTDTKNNAALTKAKSNSALTKAKNNSALTKAKTGAQ